MSFEIAVNSVIQKKNQRLNEMGRIEKLQNEIDEIKSLLYKVIDKL